MVTVITVYQSLFDADLRTYSTYIEWAPLLRWVNIVYRMKFCLKAFQVCLQEVRDYSVKFSLVGINLVKSIEYTNFSNQGNQILNTNRLESLNLRDKNQPCFAHC